MPIIRVENYPNDWTLNPVPDETEEARQGKQRKWKSELAYALRNACVAAEVLGIDKPDDVTVVFGGEQVVESDRKLVIFIEGLFDKPERTKEVRDRLAERLGKATREPLPLGWHAEVLVKRFNTEKDSFWAG